MGDPGLCVYCRKRPVQERFRPFCGERCRLLDLAQWADGSYRIAGEPPILDDDDETDSRETSS